MRRFNKTKNSKHERVIITKQNNEIVYSEIIQKERTIMNLLIIYPEAYFNYKFTECNY